MQDSISGTCEIHPPIEDWYSRSVEHRMSHEVTVRGQEGLRSYSEKVFRRKRYRRTVPHRQRTIVEQRLDQNAETKCESTDAERGFPKGTILAITKMIELLELPPGWNSYNARPIRKENVNFAINLLGRVMRFDTPVPHVIPTVRGGVQLEWHERGISLEISISSPGMAEFMAEDTSGRQSPVEGELDETALATWIDRLSG